MSPMKKVPFLANLWYLSVPLVKVLEQVCKPRNKKHQSTMNQPVAYCWAHLHCREVVDLMQTQFIYCTSIMKSIIFQCSSNNLSTLVLDLELIKLKHQQQEKHQSTSHRHQTIATPSSSTIHHNHGFQALRHQRIHNICYLEEPLDCQRQR